MGKLDLSEVQPVDSKHVEVIPKKQDSVTVLPKEKDNSYPTIPEFSPMTSVDRSTRINASFSVPIAVVTGIFDSIQSFFSAYRDIQLSHDQVRIAEAKKDAYIKGKKEETKQIKFKSKVDLKTYIIKCQHELEEKKLEFEKFKLEIEQKKNEQQNSYELTEQNLRSLREYAELLVDGAKDLWSVLKESGFQDENIMSILQLQDEKINQCIDKLLKINI